jgi:hypothetical protein
MTLTGKTSLGIRGEGPGRWATKVSGGEPNRVQHRLDQGDVDRMPVVRPGRDSKLDRAKECACFLGNRGLKRFGCRSKKERPIDVT